MKSEASEALPVLFAILQDVRRAYPAETGWDRDEKRLTQLCQTRGLGFLSLDLPTLDELLLAGLEEGRLPASFGAFGHYSKKCRVPRLFAGLWLRVFDKSAVIKPDVDFTAVAFLRQLAKLGKKIAVGASVKRRYAALEKYHEVESSIRPPTLDWEGDLLDPENRQKGLHLREVLAEDAPLLGEILVGRGRANILLGRVQQYADLLLSRFSMFDPVSWSDRMMSEEGYSGFRHGPGAVQERLKNHEKSEFLEWPWKLESIFPFGSFGRMPNDVREPIRKERPSRLIMVNKTLKGPRIICAEPVTHQWCQQAILGFVNHELRRLFKGDFVDFHDQGKSGRMVLQASRDRKHSTIDLSDASDRLSCFVVERIFRKVPELTRAIHASRTRYVYIEYRKHKYFLKLKKYATQGTAVTFPVQSICFLAMALAASHRGGPVSWSSLQKLRKDVRVYGDDIIIPTHGYADLKNIMTWCGLKVNDTKSFSKGFFRESCGTDGYGGYDVTPCQPSVFRPHSPGKIIAVVDLSNNLFKKGYWHASEQLLSTIPDRFRRTLRYCGPDSPGVFGITSYSGISELHLRRRWNPDLHRYEVRAFGTTPKVEVYQRDGYPVLLDFFASRPTPFSPRARSEWRDSRYTKGRVHWEPSSTCLAGDFHFRIDGSFGVLESQFLAPERHLDHSHPYWGGDRGQGRRGLGCLQPSTL